MFDEVYSQLEAATKALLDSLKKHLDSKEILRQIGRVDLVKHRLQVMSLLITRAAWCWALSHSLTTATSGAVLTLYTARYSRLLSCTTTRLSRTTHHC